MTAFAILAWLTTLAAVFSWVNHRYIRLPTTIGLMVISLLFSLLLVVLGRVSPGVEEPLRALLDAIDFDDALLNGMLGALLFAGALHLNLNDLAEQKAVIAALATVGVLLSTAIVGAGVWLLFGVLDFDVPFVYCLLFGALISPTDPIAVGAILRRAGIPRTLVTKINGESLFNDGVGVVVFLVLLGVAAGSGAEPMTAGGVARLFAIEVGGGLAYGFVLGSVAYLMLRSIEQYQVEILITLAIVTGGYLLAQRLHLSGPLAMVVAGLLIGNRGRMFAMSDATRARLDSFWELIDEFLNALLFVLIGIEVLVIESRPPLLLAGLLAVPLVLLARAVAVGAPVALLTRWRSFSPHVVTILTWSGLRGAISVALALSLPAGGPREVLLTVTYVVVSFSIVVQGLTVGRLIKRLSGNRGLSRRPYQTGAVDV